MSTRVATASWLPAYGWWAMLVSVLAIGMFGNWLLAAGVLLLILIQIARPLDFVIAFLLVTAGSTFVHYTGGNLTLQLSLLTVALLWTLSCYALSRRGESLNLARSQLTLPLVAFTALSVANAVRGGLLGHPIKHVLFEIFPVLAVASAVLVANVADFRRELRLAVGALVVAAYGSACLGFYAFSVIRTHTAGVWFHPVPGMVAVLLFNLALRARTFTASLGWIVLSLPLYLEQFLSFRRGLWLGVIAGLTVSLVTFAIGRGSRTRWARGGQLLGTLLASAVAGAIAMATLYGQTDILTEAGGRFASIGSTELTPETRSNVSRLVEYATVAKLIQASPWVGHGVGYTFTVMDPLYGSPKPQWWVHQNYLLIWLKQGLLGLLAFLWLLGTGIWFCARQARRRTDPWEGSWFAASAGGTAFLAAFSLSDFPFDQTEAVFLLALLLGGSMAMGRDGFMRLRWAPASGERERQDTASAE